MTVIHKTSRCDGIWFTMTDSFPSLCKVFTVHWHLCAAPCCGSGASFSVPLSVPLSASMDPKAVQTRVVRVTQMPSVSSFTVLKNFWWFQAIIWVLSSSFDFILLGEREIRRQVFCPELISSKQIRATVKKYGRHVLFTSTWTTFDCLSKEGSQTKYTVQV